MSDISKLGLGQIIKTEQQKDAVHMAIAPIRAAMRLSPGQHVGLDKNGNATNRTDKAIGVIDPFLKMIVMQGEFCWLFLYPGTITGLRHEWSHPAFGGPASHPEVVSAKSDSEKWMRRWAIKYMDESNYDNEPVNEDICYEAAIRAGHTMSVGSNESARDYIDDTWWNHWEIITGKRGQRGEYFSCGC